jgi:Leucine-rich repeat (LRR) protein
LTGSLPPASAQDAKPAPAKPAVKEITPEQMEAAKKLAQEIGGRLKEDAQGNVIAIDMAVGRSWADDNQMRKILVFPKLESLVIEGPGITDQLVPRIAKQQELVSLTLKNTLIGDDGLAKLAGLPKLKIIDVRVAPMITDRGMESLVKMASLKAVRLVGGNITDRGVITLLQIPQLSELDVRNCRGVTKKGIEEVVKKDSIRTLKLGGSAINDSVLALIAEMPKLTGLCLDGCELTNAGLEKIAALPIEDLELHQCPKVTDEGLNVLGNYKNLKRLTIQGTSAKCAALAKLPSPEKLVALNLVQSGITDAEVAALVAFTHLENLNLSQTAITDAAIETLSKLTSLKQLVMTQTHVTEEGAKKLRQAMPNCTIRTN